MRVLAVAVPARRLHVTGLAAVTALGAMLASAVLLGAHPAGASAGRVGLRATAGYGSPVRPGSWVPVEMVVEGGDRAVRGRLEVTPGLGREGTTCIGSACGSQFASVVYRVPVDVPAGVTKHYHLDVPVSGTGVHVALRAGGGTVAAVDTRVAVATGGSGPVIAVVSDGPSTLDALGAVRVESGPVQVVHLLPGELPQSSVALQGFDSVIVDGAATSSLLPSQAKALRDHVVADGGSLVVAGGAAWRTTLAGIPEALLPVRVADVRAVEGLPDLAGLLGGVPVVGAAAVAQSEPTAGGRVLIREGELPLLVSADRGLGRVMFLAVDPAVEPLVSWPSTIALLRQIAVRAARPPAPGPIGNWGGRVSIAERGPGFTTAIARIRALALPGAGGLAIALLAYAAVVGPANYLVLRRLGRRDLAWVTIPAVGLLAGLVAYTTGLGVRTRTALISQVRLVTIAPEPAQDSYVESYAGLYTPHGGDFRLSAPGDPRVTTFSGLDESGGRLAVTPGSPTRVDFESTGTGSLHALAGVDIAHLPKGGVATDLRLEGGSLTGTVTNHLGTDLTDVQVFGGQGPSTLGTLADGGSRQIAVADPGGTGGFPPGAGGQFGYSTFGSSGMGPSRSTRRRAVLDALRAQYATGAPGAVLVGLTARPLLPPSFTGEKMSLDTVDVVIVHLEAGPPQPGGAFTVRADPIDTPAPTGRGGAGLSPESLAVYQFVLPPTAAGPLRVTVAPAATTAPPRVFNPGGGSAPVTAQPAPAPPQAPLTGPPAFPGFSAPPGPPVAALALPGPAVDLEVYDAAARRWSPLASSTPQGGDHDVDAAAAGSDGVLVVRARNSSGYAAPVRLEVSGRVAS